jgi:MscS family membrane protein
MNRLFALLFTLFFIPVSGIEYTSEYTQGYDFSTPRRTMVNFMANLQDDQYYPDRAIKSFNFTKVKGRNSKIEKAILFKKYIDARGYLLDEEVIPDEADFLDTVSKLHRYFPFSKESDIYLEKVNGVWKFSKMTVEKIDELYGKAYPIGSSWFLKLMPRQLKGTFADIHYWKWIGLLYLLAFSTIFFYFFRFLVAEIVTKFIEYLGKEQMALRLLRPVSGPTALLVVLGILKLLFPLIQFPVQVSHYVQLTFNISIPILIVFVLYKLVDILALYFDRIAEKTESKLDIHLVPLLRRMTKVVVVALGLIFVLQNLGYNVTGLLAGLSIGGLALALAAQDTIKNLLGSLMIYMDKPFQIGDWITGEGVDGHVEEVGFRASRIRTFSNSLMYVPNAKLADMISDNHGRREYIRYKTMLSLTYDTSPAAIQVFIDGLKQITIKYPVVVEEKNQIYLYQLADSSINIQFCVFFVLKYGDDEFAIREELLFQVIRLAEFLDIRFAFPTQTIHVENMPGQIGLTPTVKNDDKNLRGRLETFMSSVTPSSPSA